MPFDGLPQNDVLNVLLKARTIVEHGWCKNQLHSEDEKHCTIGAIILAITSENRHLDSLTKKDQKLYRKILTSFVAELPKTYPRYYDGWCKNQLYSEDEKHCTSRNRYAEIPIEQVITSWNDMKSRRKLQVLKQFDKVIAQQFA